MAQMNSIGPILFRFLPKFNGDVQGDGGCETCGYGAPIGMSQQEFEHLLKEIDLFIAENYTPKAK